MTIYSSKTSKTINADTCRSKRHIVKRYLHKQTHTYKDTTQTQADKAGHRHNIHKQITQC